MTSVPAHVQVYVCDRAEESDSDGRATAIEKVPCGGRGQDASQRVASRTIDTGKRTIVWSVCVCEP